MESNNKKVIKNSVLYISTNLIIRCFNFFLLPLYTTYLTTADYGIMTLVASFSGTISIVLSVGLNYAVPRFYVEYKENHEKVKRFFGTLIFTTFAVGILFCAIYFATHNFLDEIFFSGMSFFPIIFIAVISLVFNAVQGIYVAILYAMQDGRRAMLRSIMFFCTNLFFNLLFVVGFRVGALGVILAGLIANVLLCGYAIFDLNKRDILMVCIDFAILKENIRYSIFFLPYSMSSQIAQWVSKLFVNTSFKLAVVGIFGLALQFGMIADNIQSSIYSAVKPWIFNHIKKAEEKGYKEAKKYSLLICWLCCAVFMLIAIFSQEVILLFLNKDYAKAWTLVPVVVATCYIKIPFYFYLALASYSKNASKWIFAATLISSAINIILSYILIQRYGMYGSIFADAIAMVIRVVIIVLIAKDYNVVKYKIGEFYLIIITSMIITAIGLALSYTRYLYEINIVNVLYKIGICIVFMGVVLFRYRKMIVPVIRKRLGRNLTVN